jgi:DUF1680 family protein
MMKRTEILIEAAFLSFLLAFPVGAEAAGTGTQKDYPIRPVPFTDVQIEDDFWAPRLETNRKVSIPYAFRQIEETGIVDNFAIAGGLKQGSYQGGRQYHDSEFFKVIEGASYTLRLTPDTELERYVTKLADLIAAAQEDDGYLYTWRTVDPEGLDVRRCGKTRWSNLSFGHELYNVGHLYEAALAYYQATGNRTLLDVAVKNAELINKEFGPGRRTAPPGHQEIEIGLCKLYRLTGDERYLKLAKFFLDERGYQHGGRELYGAKRQDHKPVLEQDEAVGHAVRAGYMYSAMADVAALTGDERYIKAIDTIWENVVSKKQCITGSVGARHKNEAFGDNYELPNRTAYNETCAAIANMMWNHRLFLLHGDAKYIDVLERVLYNGFLPGVSLSGDKFFYCNPLESDGKWKFNKGWATRFPWSASMCCPTNVTRFLPSLPGYMYAQRDDTVYINLFIGGSGKVRINDNTVLLTQETRYPWDGKVKITVEPERAAEFAIYVRIPGWASNQPVPSDLYRYVKENNGKVTLRVNGRRADLNREKGFAKLRRKWKKGDVIQLSLPMSVRRVLCNERVEENRGKMALERGPIVYCVEWFDNGGKIDNIKVSDDDEFEVACASAALGGVNVIKGTKSGFLAIPYYAWSHRGVGEMAVWLPRNAEETGPSQGFVLKADSFKHYVDRFNENDVEYFPPSISNEEAWEFMKTNIPLLGCPDRDIEEIYYFRWWTYRKHIKDTPDGFVIDEFRPKVSWGAKHNTISCAAGHHIYEGRWLHDPKNIWTITRYSGSGWKGPCLGGTAFGRRMRTMRGTLFSQTRSLSRGCWMGLLKITRGGRSSICLRTVCSGSMMFLTGWRNRCAARGGARTFGRLLTVTCTQTQRLSQRLRSWRAEKG